VESKAHVLGYELLWLFKSTVEPGYNEVPWDLENVFVLMAICYIRVLYHTFYYNYWAEKYSSLYQSL